MSATNTCSFRVWSLPRAGLYSHCDRPYSKRWLQIGWIAPTYFAWPGGLMPPQADGRSRSPYDCDLWPIDRVFAGPPNACFFLVRRGIEVRYCCPCRSLATLVVHINSYSGIEYNAESRRWGQTSLSKNDVRGSRTNP